MEHRVIRSPLDSLRPTQMTLGYVEVQWKRAEWHRLSRKRRRELLHDHVVPCVIGPAGRRYVIDHHHLCVALREEGADSVWTHALEDLGWLDVEVFWRTLDFRRWLHPYDAKGRRHDYAELPRKFTRMRDDPYRSLAALVRRRGGFSKDMQPYAEFEWAQFFRDRLRLRPQRAIAGTTLRAALKAARSADARYLPGWVGEGER
jgi:hypothetical protein